METEEFAGKWTNLWGVGKHSMVWQLQTTQWDWSVESEGTVVVLSLDQKSGRSCERPWIFMWGVWQSILKSHLRWQKVGFGKHSWRVLCSEYVPPYVSLGLIWICIPRIDFSPILHVSHSKPWAWLQRQTICSRWGLFFCPGWPNSCILLLEPLSSQGPCGGANPALCQAPY